MQKQMSQTKDDVRNTYGKARHPRLPVYTDIVKWSFLREKKSLRVRTKGQTMYIYTHTYKYKLLLDFLAFHAEI